MTRNVTLCSSIRTRNAQISSSPQQLATADDLYDKWQDKILYSSYLDSITLKMGYRQNKIIESKMKRYEKYCSQRSKDVQPFPVVLKQIERDQFDLVDTGEVDPDEANRQLDASMVYQMPFRRVGMAVPKSTDMEEEHDKKLTTGAWMSDYEYYDEDEQSDAASFYGTPDPKEPSSHIPCGGCGALLHCIEPSIPGYLPSQLFKRKSKEQLMTTICQRCHFLKHYNIAVNVTVSPEDYIEMISSIKDKKALAVLLVDLLDFPCSIWPGLAEILGPNRPILVAGNKVDLLPQPSRGYLENVRQCLTKSIIDSGFARSNIKHVSLISANTGYGVEELITRIHNIWGTRGDVYLVGCTNVGKSTLFNALLRSDLCKVLAADLVQRATASPWPGTTIRMLKFPILRPSDFRLYQRTQRLQQLRDEQRAEQQLRQQQAKTSGNAKYATLIGHIGRTFEKEKLESHDHFSVTQRTGGDAPILTLNEKNERYVNSKWCYDTPGVVQPDQILDLLTTEEILQTVPKEIIRPRTYLLKTGMTIFLAGLGRLDYVSGPDSIRVILYAAMTLPTLICNTTDAAALYTNLIGTDMLGVPYGTENRLANWPALESAPDILVHGAEDKHLTVCDILLSSAGWFGINLPRDAEAVFRAWTPNRRGVHVRLPALLPTGLALRGKRIRGSLAYRVGAAFKAK
ncbi:nitric oxide-associated protein 1 [Anopheles ziemanni]|uniref:nitric oxide-associated protein 1 n=1 Tax=Anopheles coustani TaxID=139045 RepID=UPI0026586458|nr:nitric oxide-associated protein 1 [Anopheles coustani]XP_058175483.1 nitric oxide-associated protein 1 [Anopheles ziemanni]